MNSSNHYGIQGAAAPDWGVDEWLNLPDGKTSLNLSDFAGKIVYLYLFQSWCPGCHSHGFPTLNAVRDYYADSDEIAFVAIQTVFEGFHVNTLDAARDSAERHGLTFPIGHDAPNGQRSNVMTHYRTGGTPWTVIIDKQGIVQFNGFQANPGDLSRLIATLINPLTTEEPL